MRPAETNAVAWRRERTYEHPRPEKIGIYGLGFTWVMGADPFCQMRLHLAGETF